MPRAAFSGDTLKCHYLAETARRRAGCFGGAGVVVDESTHAGRGKGPRVLLTAYGMLTLLMAITGVIRYRLFPVRVIDLSPSKSRSIVVVPFPTNSN
jgi:hypothetical protein